jgi:hypothetical protein
MRNGRLEPATPLTVGRCMRGNAHCGRDTLGARCGTVRRDELLENELELAVPRVLKVGHMLHYRQTVEKPLS